VLPKYEFHSYRNVVYIDEYYPFKYIFKLLDYMLKNFQIKYINPVNKRWTLEVFKNYMSCKKTTTLLIPKNYLDEMVGHFHDFKKFPCEEYHLIFSRILDNLQKISNLVSSNCSNLQNFLNFIKHRIILKSIFESSHFDNKQFRHLSGWISIHLRKHKFTKAGIDFGKLLSVLAENIDYNNIKKKSSKKVHKISSKVLNKSSQKISKSIKKINKPPKKMEKKVKMPRKINI
jgi:hypothetical protein